MNEELQTLLDEIEAVRCEFESLSQTIMRMPSAIFDSPNDARKASAAFRHCENKLQTILENRDYEPSI